MKKLVTKLTKSGQHQVLEDSQEGVVSTSLLKAICSLSLSIIFLFLTVMENRLPKRTANFFISIPIPILISPLGSSPLFSKQQPTEQ